MVNRKRKIAKKVMLTEQEAEQIEKNMNETGIETFGDYARKMLLDGYIVKADFSAVREVAHQLSKIGNNVNQVARRVNTDKNAMGVDLQEIRTAQTQIIALLQNLMRKSM